MRRQRVWVFEPFSFAQLHLHYTRDEGTPYYADGLYQEAPPKRDTFNLFSWWQAGDVLKGKDFTSDSIERVGKTVIKIFQRAFKISRKLNPMQVHQRSMIGFPLRQKWWYMKG